MSKRAIHLHRDYLNAWCGKDAAHLAMTLDPEDMTCSRCRAAIVKHRKGLEGQRDKAAAEIKAAAKEAAGHQKKVDGIAAEFEHIEAQEAKLRARREELSASYHEAVASHREAFSRQTLGEGRAAQLEQDLGEVPSV